MTITEAKVAIGDCSTPVMKKNRDCNSVSVMENTAVSTAEREPMTRLRLMMRSMSHKRWCRIATPIDSGINRAKR